MKNANTDPVVTLASEADCSVKRSTHGWRCAVLSTGLLALAGCSPHAPTPQSLSSAAKAQKSSTMASRVARQPSPNSSMAWGSAIDQVLLAPHPDDPQENDLGLSESGLGLEGQGGMIWDRMRSGFGLSLNEPQSVRREMDTLSPRFIERSLAQSSEYLYLVLDEVERRGMPSEIALLPLMESGYNPTAVSPGKAAGLWQFLPETARNFGLKLTHAYDGRRDVLASTHAALDYLDHLGDTFGGDWLLALTAYNTGEGTLQRWIEQNRRQGKPTDFASLPIPPETRRYIPRLMAIRSIIENPGRHGVELPAIPNRPVLDIVDVQGRLDLAEAANLANLSLSQMLRYNPGVQDQKTIALSSPLLMPTTHARRLRQQMENGDVMQLAQQNRASRLSEAQAQEEKSLMHEAELALTETQPPDDAPMGKTHTVRGGDSLYSIAQAHHLDSADLARWNKLSQRTTLKIGQKLVLQDPHKPHSRSTDSAIMTYSVRAGDSLASIAHKFDVSVAELSRWNELSPKRELHPGQRLTIHKTAPERRTGS